MARRGLDRGEGGELCRQAGREAPGADVGAVRPLGATPPAQLVGPWGHGLGPRHAARARGLRARGGRARGRSATSLGRCRDRSRGPSMTAGPATRAAPLAYFWGDDAYSLDAAVEAFRRDPARF